MTLVRKILRAPGLWLCNLGFHQAQRGGRMAGYTRPFEIKPGVTYTASYLECQRCGRDYPGSVLVPDWRRFP